MIITILSKCHTPTAISKSTTTIITSCRRLSTVDAIVAYQVRSMDECLSLLGPLEMIALSLLGDRRAHNERQISGLFVDVVIHHRELFILTAF